MESKAYVSNLRQKLATGAVVLAVQMHYYEWWSRALKPGIHFVPVSEGDDMCDDIVKKVVPRSTLQSRQECLCRCTTQL